MSAAQGPRIGSLCSGYEGLGMAVQAVLGGQLTFVADPDPGAAKILAHHHPHVPNLGDITQTDWESVPQVDVLTAGFPCQDVSLAGARKGMRKGTRSGLWLHVLAAIRTLQPELVVIENVPGLRTAAADSDVEPCPWCMGNTERERPVRALGGVLAGLADLGFDAEWISVPASGVGAPHRRERVFLLAWPAAHPESFRRIQGWAEPAGVEGRPDAALGGGAAPAHPQNLGHQRSGFPWGRGTGPAHRSDTAAHTASIGHRNVGAEGIGGVEATPVAGGPERPVRLEVSCPTCGHPEPDHDDGGYCAGCGTCADPELGRPHGDHGTAAPAHPDRDALRQQPVPIPERGGAPVAELDGVAGEAAAHADRRPVGTVPHGEPAGPEADDLDDGVDTPGRLLGWVDYAPAIARWEHITGRRHPVPTEPGRTGQPRLNPVFVEWMQGLPAGHVTDPEIGLTRTQQLHALGNGVVPQQGAHALDILLDRAFGAPAAVNA